jgi:hypothetical protein
MRTTLSIDDDVLHAVKAIADQQNRSAGEVISELARKSLLPSREVARRNGIPQLPLRPGAPLVTLEMVNALRDEAP